MQFLDDDDRLEDRREVRRRQLGTHTPTCSSPGCDESDPLALVGVHPDILCYECSARNGDRSASEEHHVPGQRNDQHDTVGVPGNDHRVLSELQQTWPTETLRNPNASPLIKAAACLRGWLDLLRLVIDRTVGWVPPFLERLDTWLVTTHGPRWYLQFQAQEG